MVDRTTFGIDKDQMADEMMCWCERLSALGVVVRQLGFHNDQNLLYSGEALGSIIVDYATILEDAVKTAYEPIREFYCEDGGSLVNEMRKEYELLKKVPITAPFHNERIKECLERLAPVLKEAKQLTELNKQFLQLKEAAGKNQQNMPKTANG